MKFSTRSFQFAATSPEVDGDEVADPGEVDPVEPAPKPAR